MTIADEYLATTGETVGQACREMHERGFGIERASLLIGYRTSSDLRIYLSRRGLPCPWPKKRTGPRAGGHPPVKTNDAAMERYAALRKAGVPAAEAAASVESNPDAMRRAIRRHRPDQLADAESGIAYALGRGCDVIVFGMGRGFGNNAHHNLEIARNAPTLAAVKRLAAL